MYNILKNHNPSIYFEYMYILMEMVYNMVEDNIDNKHIDNNIDIL